MSDYTPKHIEAAEPKAPVLTNSRYDMLKQVNQLGLPAFATFYLAIATIWGLPNPDKVVATCAALAVFLGVVLALASRNYVKSGAKYDGVISVTEHSNGVKTASLDLKNYEDPADIVNQDEAVFKVNKL
jgi:hypothetical protein